MVDLAVVPFVFAVLMVWLVLCVVMAWFAFVSQNYHAFAGWIVAAALCIVLGYSQGRESHHADDVLYSGGYRVARQ